MNNFYCYLLKNNHDQHKNRTYNGFTVNPKKRLRQHNQEIKGGARYTKKYGNKTWEVYCLITGFPDKINALQCEWKIKHPVRKKVRPSKYNSPEGRIKGLNKVLKLNKWTSNSTCNNNDYNFKVWILNDYIYLLTDLPDNIEIIGVDRIDLNTLV